MTPARDTTAIYAPQASPGYVEWKPGTIAGIVFDVVTLAVTSGYAMLAVGLGIGSPDDPGPGFFPLIAAALVILCLTIDLVRRVLLIAGGRRIPGSGRVSWQVVGIVGAIAFYFVTLAILGHTLAATALVAALLFLLGSRRWWMVIGIAILSATLSDLLFTTVLGLHLPTGLFNVGWSEWT